MHDSISKAYTEAPGLKSLCPGLCSTCVTILLSVWHIPYLCYFILLQVNIWYKEDSFFTWFIQETEIRMVDLKIIIIWAYGLYQTI